MLPVVHGIIKATLPSYISITVRGTFSRMRARLEEMVETRYRTRNLFDTILDNWLLFKNVHVVVVDRSLRVSDRDAQSFPTASRQSRLELVHS